MLVPSVMTADMSGVHTRKVYKTRTESRGSGYLLIPKDARGQLLSWKEITLQEEGMVRERFVFDANKLSCTRQLRQIGRYVRESYPSLVAFWSTATWSSRGFDSAVCDDGCQQYHEMQHQESQHRRRSSRPTRSHFEQQCCLGRGQRQEHIGQCSSRPLPFLAFPPSSHLTLRSHHPLFLTQVTSAAKTSAVCT